MSEQKPECPETKQCVYDENNQRWHLHEPCTCIQAIDGFTKDEAESFIATVKTSGSIALWQDGFTAGLTAAREAVAALHQRVPVIECACGWGNDCPECGSESNRVVGYACDRCCNSFGDHAYCDDMHYDDDDTPLHHRDGLMWSGPHCPTMAAIDALRRESDV